MKHQITDPEELARLQRDPDAYHAIERLHDAYEQLRDALDDRVQETGLRLDPNPLMPPRPPEELTEAREFLAAAEAEWAAAVDAADALLREREGA